MIGVNVIAVEAYQRLVDPELAPEQVHVVVCTDARRGRRNWVFTVTPAQFTILSRNIKEAVLTGNGYLVPETMLGWIGWAWYRE